MIPLRVLLIEDSELDAGLILRQLKEAGYETTSLRVDKESQLLEALKQQWDFIIADYRLPGFTANDALAMVQDSGIDTPFVIVSGAIGEEIAVGLMKAGARDYLMKDKLSRLPPVVERELVEVNIRRLQKQAHEALLESERNLKKSQQVAHIGHWVFDFTTGKTTWSDELYKILGLKPHQVNEDHTAAWQGSLHPEDKARVLDFTSRKNVNSSKGEIEYRIVRPDGTVRYILGQLGDSLYDSSGQEIQETGVVHDITERKMMELDLLEKMQESQNRARELETITSISSRMRQVKTRQELVLFVLEELVKQFAADNAAIVFLDGEVLTAETIIMKGHVFSNDRIEKLSPIARDAIQAKKFGFLEAIPPDLLKEMPDWVFEKTSRPASLIAYPIINDARMIGFIHLDFEHPTTFSHEKKNFVETIAEMAGNALNRMSATRELEAMVEKRERELESIYKVTSSATATLNIRQSFQEALALTLEAVHTGSGAIFLLDETNSKLDLTACQEHDPILQGLFSRPEILRYLDQVISQNKALVIPNLSKKVEGSKKKKLHEFSFIGQPMRAQDRVVGVLAVIHPNKDQLLLEEMTLLSYIGDQLALIVENTRLYKKAERSAVLEERSRLGRELHDSVTQSLYSANLYSAGAKKFFAQNKFSEVDSYLTQISELTQQALKDMRLLVYELRSPELKRNGLIGSLQNRLDAVERRVNIDAEIHADEISGISAFVEENLYRIAIESLNNSLKYANATKISLNFYLENGDLVFSVQDNGVGFSLDQGMHSGGVGLVTMRERADRIGATYTIFTSPETGTKIEVRFSTRK